MAHLIAILVCTGLFGAYFAWVGYESRTGKRLLKRKRERLDARVSRAVFIIRHVDWSAFIGESVRTGSQKAVHAVAEGSLSLVRTIERLLTRLVRLLRERNAPATRRPVSVMESLRAMRDRFMHAKQKPVAVSEKKEEEPAPAETTTEEVNVPEEPKEDERPHTTRPSSIG